MSKLNWDRVRWETRAIKAGSEWVKSDSMPPPPSAPRTKSAPAAVGAIFKKKKEKKKEKKASNKVGAHPRKAQAAKLQPAIWDRSRVRQASSSPVGQTSHPAPLVRQAKVPARACVSLPASKPRPTDQVSLRTKKSGGNLPAFVTAKKTPRNPLPTVEELQKMSIRLFKAIGTRDFLEAASIASHLSSEIMSHVEGGSK